MRSLLLDSRRPGTVAQALHGLTEAASGVRDQLSRDTWVVLAGIERALGGLRDDPGDQGTTLQNTHAAVLSGMLALSGLAAENMIRDPGWYVMDIGRRIERSLQLVTVLRWALARV
ncbi:alpha-E domain-containing protein, partial [Raoultella terrigena]|uniref:alpha-E domain-containing protein n=1 Tax=Raoultella terrigena TaxID=577 RepID=UPI0015F2D377